MTDIHHRSPSVSGSPVSDSQAPPSRHGRMRPVEVLPGDRSHQTAPTLIPPTSLTGRVLTDIYVAAFQRRLGTLPDGLRSRVQRCRAVLVRARPTIAIEGRMIPAAVETIFEQARPGLWRFRSQLIEVDGPASAAEYIAVSAWARQRQRHFDAPDGPRLGPVFDTLASVLDSGREGRDYILLSRVPALSHTLLPIPAA